MTVARGLVPHRAERHTCISGCREGSREAPFLSPCHTPGSSLVAPVLCPVSSGPALHQELEGKRIPGQTALTHCPRLRPTAALRRAPFMSVCPTAGASHSRCSHDHPQPPPRRPPPSPGPSFDPQACFPRVFSPPSLAFTQTQAHPPRFPQDLPFSHLPFLPPEFIHSTRALKHPLYFSLCSRSCGEKRNRRTSLSSWPLRSGWGGNQWKR